VHIGNGRRVSGAPVTAQDLREVTERVWEAFVNTDGDPAAGRLRPIRRPDRPSGVWAAVTVAGAWHGVIMVSCSAAAAQRLTEVLLDLPAQLVTEGDITDALGEFTNIIGDSVKGLLPGPSTLSLPHIAMRQERVRWPAGSESRQLAVDWYDEPVLVTVLTSGTGRAA
jgi:chemotaxis protein CheX